MFTKKNKTMKRGKKAGTVVNSGGFGCLFSPALKCKKEKTRKKNYVSKLLIKKYGEQEYNILTKIHEKLKKIKNYDKHFLLKDIEKCIPDTLDKEDKKDFDNKCESLTKINIVSDNINNNLDNLVSINLPYSGISLFDWFYKEDYVSSKKLINLNNIIISLLKNAVIPMSKKHVIHGDIKDKNILIDDKKNVRIIDWGISGISTKKNIIPPEIINRPLQFNTPFSSILIGEEFLHNYDIFLNRVKKHEILFTKENISTFVINEYLVKLARYYGYYDDNFSIFNILFSSVISQDTYLSEQKKTSLLEYGYYLRYFSEYNANILIKYTNSKYNFDLKKYVEECYIYNSNIWGLLTIYYNIFYVYQNNSDKLYLNNRILTIYINNLRDLLVKYLFTNGSHKINTFQLVRDIKKLNVLLKKNKTVKKKKQERKTKTKKNLQLVSKF